MDLFDIVMGFFAMLDHLWDAATGLLIAKKSLETIPPNPFPDL